MSSIYDCGKCKKPKKLCLCGRPTKYKKEYANAMLEFFMKEEASVFVDTTFYKVPDKIMTEDMVHGTEDVAVGSLKSRSHKEIVSRFPTIERFAVMIGVHSTTLHARATALKKNNKGEEVPGSWKNPEFHYAYKRCREIQKSILIENGLAGKFQSNMVALVTSNEFDYTPKTKNETEHSGSVAISNILNDIIN